MLNSLRDGQINYGTTNCPSAHIPPHNVVAPIHQNSLIPNEPTTPVVYPWNSNPRFEHLYGYSRYYNLDFPASYPSSTNQYVPANMYGQNVPQCCQPCCRLRSQNIPKTSPSQMLYNPIRPGQQLNRSYKSKKTLKTQCSEQFLPYIPNDLPVKYETQNCYQQKYSTPYINNTSYCPSTNNLWIPPTANPTWPTDRLQHVGHHGSAVSHDFSREKNYQRLQSYQNNLYSNSTNTPHNRPYNFVPSVPDAHDYRSSVYHNSLKNSTSEYISHENNSRLPISSQNVQSPSSYQQYYNAQPVPYADVQSSSEPSKPQIMPQNSTKSNLNVRDFLANWDEGEEETSEKSCETTPPIVVLDCMTLEGDALTKIQEKLNVVSYENLEKVLKEKQNPLDIITESNEVNYINNKAKLPPKPNFEPLDYTKRETGIIKPFITEKKTLPETNSELEKNYSVNFDGMVAWYSKKNTDISSTDLIEKLADRIFNLSKSQENEGVSFGTAAYTGQITQTNRSVECSIKDSSKYVQSQQIFDLHHTDKNIEPSVINKIDCNNESISRTHACALSESNKESIIKTNNINSSCIVENTTKKCLNLNNTNEETTPWSLDQGAQEQHLNMSLYDHSVIIKPLDFSSLTDEAKGNPFGFEKNVPNDDKQIDQFNKVLNENNSYNSTIPINHQHLIQQNIDASNRNFPVIVSPHIHRQEFNGFHESVIQRTGCDKNKNEKVSTQTDFESINWNISNDLDKIMKNTNIVMESSCLYDRNNYNILDGMNSDKNVSTQWKDVPCVDLSVNSKTNPNHDTFFDGWNFIENYENHSNKKIVNPPSNNNEVSNPLFSNQIISLDESNNRNDNSIKPIENKAVKDIPLSKSNDISSRSTRSRNIFNLNNRIPDFSDGFDLTVGNEPNEYMQFKKSSNDNENRTDGSIFEHLTEPKCIKTANETINPKNDQNKSDIVGLPSFKEKEPLAPMLVPPKLNIVKPIIRDPSQMYSVIKQKLKYDNACIENDNSVPNKLGNSLRGNQTNIFNGMDFKSKYNMQLNQFDVWSEKFELKGNSNNSSSGVVQCDVEITQFKSTPENRNILIPKPSICTDFLDKNTKLLENTNCNSTEDKVNAIENNKMNSNDFLNCLESTKIDDQKYRDTLDEFETSFGFDMHCNETNKSFHEDIVDECLEERVKDQIGDHNINASNASSTLNSNTSANNSELPFQCNFQSSYLIKNYFNENKNKTIELDKKQANNLEKSETEVFNYPCDIVHNFELQTNKNTSTVQNSEKSTDFNNLNDSEPRTEQFENVIDENNSNFIDQSEIIHENTSVCKIPNMENNNFDYLTIDERNFDSENNKKNIEINNCTETNSISKIDCIKESDIDELSNIQKHSNVDFELVNTKNNSNTEVTTKTNENHELENNKNRFEPEFPTKNAENIEHHIDIKHIFELENNNSDLYQTQNLDKLHEFDFETRIIQNFEMECSDSNVQKNTKDIFSNDNQDNIEYNYEADDEDNLDKKDTNFKSSPSILKEPRLKELPKLNIDDNTQIDNLTDTGNINQENTINGIFKVGCIASDMQIKLSSDTNADLDIHNDSSEEINTCNTRKNCNNNNAEVEEIFENLCKNVTALDTKKDDLNLSESLNDHYLNDDIRSVSESLDENQGSSISDTKKDDLNLSESHYLNDDIRSVSESLDENQGSSIQINNLEIVNESCEETNAAECHNASDKIFVKTDDVLVQDCINNSVTCLTKISLEQCEPFEEKKINEITSKECDEVESDTRLINNNEKNLNVFNQIVECNNISTITEQQSDDVELCDFEPIRSNSSLSEERMMVNAVQGNNTENSFENVQSNLLILKNTDNSHENNSSRPSPLNHSELIDQHYPNQTLEVDNLINSKNISPSQTELITNKHHYDKIVEVEDLTAHESSSLILDELGNIGQQYSREIVEVDNATNFIPSSLNHIEPTSTTHSNEIVDIEDSTSDGFKSLDTVELTNERHSIETAKLNDYSNNNSSRPSSLNHVELTNQQQPNDTIKVEDSLKSEPCSLNVVEFIHKPSDEIAEGPTSTNSSMVSENIIHTANDFCPENTNSESVIDDKNIPKVKFILKCHRTSMMKTNIFDEESVVSQKKESAVKDEKCVARLIFKRRNHCYKPWQKIYRKKMVHESKESVEDVVETVVRPAISTSSDDVSRKIEIVGVDTEAKMGPMTVAPVELPVFDDAPVKSYEIPESLENEEVDGRNAASNSDVDDFDSGSFSNTPVPSPFDDFCAEPETPENYADEECWDKSLENEYKNVLHKTISKLAKIRVNIRDKFNTRLLARRSIKTKRRRLRPRVGKTTDDGCRDDNSTEVCDDKQAVDHVATVEMPSGTVVKPECKIKVQLPWGRIFNLNDRRVGEDGQKAVDTKLELGPAKVEVRLSRTPGEWQVAACEPMTSPKSVVSVRRLVLQRAATSPEEDCDDDDRDSSDTGPGSQECPSRKLPKIVIRRNGRDNYTSYVSSVVSGGLRGGDSNVDDTPRLMVRLIRDRKLDAMAVDGVTTLHLKNLDPVTNSTEDDAHDTHAAKRVRYT